MDESKVAVLVKTHMNMEDIKYKFLGLIYKQVSSLFLFLIFKSIQ